jgi:hypothetical protein
MLIWSNAALSLSDQIGSTDIGNKDSQQQFPETKTETAA